MSGRADIWMPIYIGDYLKDTQHLDATRHGCYLLWMFHYWTRGPLPDCIEDLVSVGKLRGSDAPSIAQALLSEFFSKGDDGLWHQKRVDEELEGWRAKRLKAQEKASKAANAKWSKDAPSNAPRNAPSIPQAMLGRCPSSSSSSSSSPSEEEQKATVLTDSSTSNEADPVDDRPMQIDLVRRTFRFYLESLDRDPKKYTLTEKRRDKALSRIRERLKIHDGDYAQVEADIVCAIEKLAGSNWHRENGYIDWEAQIFRSAEEFQNRMNWEQRSSGGRNGNGNHQLQPTPTRRTTQAAMALLENLRGSDQPSGEDSDSDHQISDRSTIRA